MPIRFVCRRCGATLEAPDELAAGRVRCPHCEAVCVVPDVGADDVPVVQPVDEEVDVELVPLPRREPWRGLPGRWLAFSRGCAVVKWGVVVELLALAALTVLVEVTILGELFNWKPVAAGKPFVVSVLLLYVLPLMIGSGVLGVGRTMMLRLPSDTGALGVLVGAAGLTWLRFVSLLTAVVFLALAAREDARAIQIYYAGWGMRLYLLAVVAGTVAEVTAVPAMAAVAGAMPSRLLRLRAGRLAFVLQLSAAAWVVVLAASVYFEFLADLPAPVRPAPAPVPRRGGATEVAVVVSAVVLVMFSIQATFAYLQHALYATGQGAGRTDGDRYS